MTATAVPTAETSQEKIQTDWPELLTSQDLAEFLQVHPNAPAEWRTERRVNQPRFIRVGSLIRYRMDHVLAWLNENTTGVAA